MATTTNFGWETPDDTDLVKDGAAAIRTALGGVDTSFVDLKGGTTGQVLAKASATDLDFSWVAVDPLTILDAKGDLISATAADTPARLAVGANDTVLMADSSTATGLKWASVPSGGMTLLASGTLSGTSVSLTSISQSYENLIVYVRNFTGTGVNDFILSVAGTTECKAAIMQSNSASIGNSTNHLIAGNIPTTNQNLHAYIFIPDYTAASRPIPQSTASAYISGAPLSVTTSSVFHTTAAAITQIALNAPSGFSGGTYELWGQK